MRGITLIELAVVILIIGLLAALVVTASQVIERARLQHLITSSSEYRKAINLFREKFAFFPGDFAGAARYWQNEPTGDGDWEVEDVDAAGDPFETSFVTRHLTLARLYVGEYADGSGNGGIGISITADPRTVPRTPIGGGGFVFRTLSLYGQLEYSVDAVAADNAGNFVQGILSVEDAYYVDKKFDDGWEDGTNVFGADTGTIRVSNSGSATGGCVNIAITNIAVPNYVLNNAGRNCRLHFVEIGE